MTGAPLAVAQPANCRYEADRTAVVEADGAKSLNVVARAGDLVVAGVQGREDVRVRARACAATAELLEGIQLSAQRDGDTVRIEALLPREDFPENGDARLDVVMEVPAGIAAEIVDSSGSIELRGLGELNIDDSSGEISVENTTGPLKIKDSAGSIYAASIGANVEIEDSAGDIELRDVGGEFTVSDSSGDIAAKGIEGSVTVREDGSGSIRVSNVGGDLVVFEDDNRGNVHYREVRGSVRFLGDD